MISSSPSRARPRPRPIALTMSRAWRAQANSCFDAPSPPMRKDAEISAGGRYRYWLARDWGAAEDERLVFVMLNPSTADASLDDPTIRRCVGFARREGCGGIFVVNLYALRATAPADLNGLQDPIGPGNAAAWRMAFDVARRPLVCAWGAGAARDLAHVAGFVGLAENNGVRLVCLGKTRDGHPRHPLYVPADKRLERWP